MTLFQEEIMKIAATLIATLITTSAFAITGIGSIDTGSHSISNLANTDPIKNNHKEQIKDRRDIANSKQQKPTNALSYLDQLRRKFKE